MGMAREDEYNEYTPEPDDLAATMDEDALNAALRSARATVQKLEDAKRLKELAVPHMPVTWEFFTFRITFGSNPRRAYTYAAYQMVSGAITLTGTTTQTFPNWRALVKWMREPDKMGSYIPVQRLVTMGDLSDKRGPWEIRVQR